MLSTAAYTQTATQPLGSGTVQFPYLINSLENLYWIAASDIVVPDPPQSGRWAAHYLQITFIDASTTYTWFSGAGFPPIGSQFIQFTGSYDGNGNLISSIHVNSGTNYAGLFGFIGGAGSVYNLQLSPTVHGNDWVGGIAGLSEGTISNCAVMGGDITGNEYVGGLAGQNENSISKCYTDITGGGSVYGVSNIGGIAGLNNSSLNNSYSHSTVTGQFNVGGIAGYNNGMGNISKCFNTGTVSGNTNPGGLVGFNNFGMVSSSFWNIITSTQGSSSGGGTGSYTGLMQEAGTYLAESWDFTLSGATWAMNDSYNNGYPYLRWQGMVSAHIWLGISSTDWSTAGNWSEGTIPDATKYVVVAPVVNHLDIGSDATADCNNLIVETDASLTIESGGSLITAGDITNNGTITMQQTLTGAVQAWHMVSGPAVADISDNGWNPGDNDDFYVWKETDPGTWVNYKNTTTSPTFSEVNGSDNFVAGNGYMVAYNSLSPAKSIVGTPNTGDVAFTLKNSGSKSWTYTSGWNLLGNPYPSSIDWNDADRSLFVDNYAYIYDPNKDGGEGYISVDGGSASAYIAPFQGFMVVAAIASNNQNFTFTNAIRDHGGIFLKDQSATEGLIVRLSHKNWYNEATIRLRDESEHTRDRQDALKLFSFNSAVPQLYSQSSDMVSLAVNSIPLAQAGEPLALGMLLPEEGLFTLTLQQTDEILAVNGLYLEDRLMGTFHKLSDQPYQFTAEQGSIDERFRLHCGVVGVEETTPNQLILIWLQNNQIYLKGAENYYEAGLFDLQGRLLQRITLTGDNLQSIKEPQQTGLFILMLLGDGKAVSKKLFIK
ncbi:MAG: hypothetical protein COW63_07070 [Bacteroidetes bacterium CG18_big_fil_WC_8_21_14_2_50_41_14]|nr:MAG: hypothetical protein COW63_07070 [Bacteroidetes bacterium CG18_big_fil_WC_8_21_14_2_50_41_14]